MFDGLRKRKDKLDKEKPNFVCPKCKENVRFVRFPLFDRVGKPVWINWFKMELFHFIFLVIIVCLIVSYKIEISHYEDVIEYPRTYCDSYCFREYACTDTLSYDLVVSVPGSGGGVYEKEKVVVSG